MHMHDVRHQALFILVCGPTLYKRVRPQLKIAKQIQQFYTTGQIGLLAIN
jgi:hypothetical protein